MSGFGVQTKNINELIKKIEKEIAYIQANLNKDITILTNKLSICTSDLLKLKTECDELKTYAHEEYEYLNEKTRNLELQIDDIRSRLNTIQYKGDFIEKCASGINEFPIYAKYAEKDKQGRDIAGSINTLSAAITDLSGKSVKYMGDKNINELNQLFNTLTTANINENYGVSGVTGWKEKLNNGTYSFLRVSNEDHVIWTGNKWKRYIDNEQTNAISIDFINNLKFGS